MPRKPGRPVANKHKVPVREWRKWSRNAQRVFNTVMAELRPHMQVDLTHPSAPLMPKAHWETIRWNAAFATASTLRRL